MKSMLKLLQRKDVPAYIGIALGYFGNYLYIPHLVATVGFKHSGSSAGFISQTIGTNCFDASTAPPIS